MLAATEMICILLGVGRAFMYLACGADGPALPKVIHKTLNKPKTCSAVIILCSKLGYEIIIDKVAIISSIVAIMKGFIS